MRVVKFALFITLWFSGNSMAEEIKYKAIKQEGQIEFRKYETVVSAEVQVSGDRREAATKAFRILVQYINGQNNAEERIPMTAPVSQLAVSSDRRVSPNMKKDRTQLPSSNIGVSSITDNAWKVMFYMPPNMSLEKTPSPSDKRITIRKVDALEVAVIRFSGSGSHKNLEEHTQKLLSYLNKHNYQYKPNPRYAFYNPPYIPFFLRRNEVMLELEGI